MLNDDDRGVVRLEGERITIELRPDPNDDGWWYVEHPPTGQAIRTNDPDMVALFWFCCEATNPPWVWCDIETETSVIVTAGDTAHEIEAATPDQLRDAVLVFLSELVDRLDIPSASDPESQQAP